MVKKIDVGSIKENKKNLKFKNNLIKEKYIKKNIIIKSKINSLSEPNFHTIVYCIKPSDTNNTLTISIDEIYKCINGKNSKELFNFYICLIHGANKNIIENCIHCTLFLEFSHSFVLHTKFSYYFLPPPVLYTPKSLNFLKPFLDVAKNSEVIKTDEAKDIINGKELTFYNTFKNCEYKGGNLKNISSGKTSFIRNKILGFQTNGLRGTLVIDSSLNPNYISIPNCLYDNLNLATPLVIVNRAPSINNTCIYTAELLRNKKENDYTIHINPFMTEGLHADQDGDEVTIFYIKRKNDEPSIEMKTAICELKKHSWKYGIRHNISYEPRYQFTQYHKFILHKFNDFFSENCIIWNNLKGSTKEKCEKMMNLGCSIFYDEIDEFIELLINFTKKLNVEITSTYDILNGCGIISDVVKSGSKGSNDHVKTYLQNLFENDSEYENKLINSFNKYIEASNNMGIGGHRQFILLYCVNSLTLHGTSIYCNDSVLLENITDSIIFTKYYYNTVAIEFIFDLLLNDHNLLLSDEDIFPELLKFSNNEIDS